MNPGNLQWVHDEIRSRLNEARLAVESHAIAPEDWQHLEHCAQLVHQVHRVLSLIGLHGAALLVEETGALAGDLLARRIECSADTHEALMRSLVDLAGHLDRLRAGWREHPLDLLQMVNDLRSARGAPLVSPGALFAPPLWRELPANAARSVRLRRPVADIVRRLRTFYQASLLAVLRAGESGARDALLQMDEILERVEMLAAGRPALRQWWVARALVQDLAGGEIELTVAVKRLLAELDAGMRNLIRDGTAALDARPAPELLRHMLYYVGSSAVRDGRSGAVKAVFQLDRLLVRSESGTGAARHAAALSAVAGPLQEQLGELEETLGAQAEHVDPDALAARVRQLAVTFGLLGADGPRKALQARAEQLQEPAEEGRAESRYLGLAEDLLRARAVVASLTRPGVAGIPDAAEIASIGYREAVAQAVAQVRNELFAVKEGLNAFAAGQAEPAELLAVADGTERSMGVLRLLGHAPAAALAPWIWVLKSAAESSRTPLERRALEQLAHAILEVEADLDEVVDASTARWVDTPRPAAARSPSPSAEHAPAPPKPCVPVAPARAVAAVPAMAATPAGAHESDEEMDEELKAVFAEEMTEVIDVLREQVPQWSGDPSRRDALVEIRRAFHTLKGSGRVVGALEVGDFAWSVEQLLNRLIEGNLGSSPRIGTLVSEAADVLPEMLVAFRSGAPLPPAVHSVRERAEAMAA